MDWKTSCEHALGALSETEVGKARIHYGGVDVLIGRWRSADSIAEQDCPRLFLNGHP